MAQCARICARIVCTLKLRYFFLDRKTSKREENIRNNISKAGNNINAALNLDETLCAFIVGRSSLSLSLSLSRSTDRSTRCFRPLSLAPDSKSSSEKFSVGYFPCSERFSAVSYTEIFQRDHRECPTTSPGKATFLSLSTGGVGGYAFSKRKLGRSEANDRLQTIVAYRRQ